MIEFLHIVSPDKSVDATGVSFTAAIVTVNTCESVKSPSVTLTVKFSVPLKSAGAEKLKSEPSKVATISVPVVTLYVRSSPSISVADKVTPPELSSSKDTLSNVASTGASLTVCNLQPSISVDTDALSVNSPSETYLLTHHQMNVNSSAP